MTNEGGNRCKFKSPAPELAAVVAGLNAGVAIDLAAGSGRHASWLAERGWDVTAVDIVLPQEQGGRVRWIQADLESECLCFEADLVVCWLYWQADLMPVIAASLRPGGIVALAGKLSGRFATSLSRYREAFAGWEELAAGEDGVKAWFIARWPLGRKA
jgi:hypothetical protein